MKSNDKEVSEYYELQEYSEIVWHHCQKKQSMEQKSPTRDFKL